MSSWSVTFDQQCRLAGLPEPMAEHQFAKEYGRRWRFDWAFVEPKVAIEVEGGAFIGGRHTRGAGFVRDMEKYNHATLLGWRVLRVLPKQIENGEALTLVERVLRPKPTSSRFVKGDPRAIAAGRKGQRVLRETHS